MYSVTTRGSRDEYGRQMEPDDTELFCEEDEVEYLLIEGIIDDGEVKRTVFGMDDHTEEEIEIEVSDYIGENTIDLLDDMMDNLELESLDAEQLIKWLINNVAPNIKKRNK